MPDASLQKGVGGQVGHPTSPRPRGSPHHGEGTSLRLEGRFQDVRGLRDKEDADVPSQVSTCEVPSPHWT